MNTRIVERSAHGGPARVLPYALWIVFGMLVYPAPGSAQLRISEIACDPVEDYDNDGEVNWKSDEFVEIVNVSDTEVDLTHWYLKDGTGDSYHYGFDGTLAPGAVKLVTGTMSQIWQAVNEAGTSGLSLNNTGEIVELWHDDPAGERLLMDQVTVPPHAAGEGRSLALDLESGQYVLHDGLSPYGGSAEPQGTGCPPGPGESSTCLIGVPVESQAWGALKAAFDR